MLDRTLAERYAKALYRAAPEKFTPSQTLEELVSVNATIAAEKSLKKFFYHPVISAAEKKKVASALFAGRLSPHVLSFLDLLLAKRRINYSTLIAQVFGEICDMRENRVRARAQAARALSKDDVHSLAGSLGKMLDKTVIVAAEINPDVLAGVKILLGHTVIDGSAAYRLKRLSQALARG